MIPATDKANYRGPIFINPGGPGASGTEFTARAGSHLFTVVGPSFDILGFDPRGTGWSTPLGVCFDTSSQRDIWESQEGDRLLNASDPTTVGLFRARASAVAERCQRELGGEWGIGRHMTTAYVVRDMVEIMHKLGQTQIQYWGFVSYLHSGDFLSKLTDPVQSYGSILGQYLAAMHPEKIKRVIIDGIHDAYNYRASLWNTNLVEVDRAVDTLFTDCNTAGPDKCEIYDTSPAKIRARYFSVLDAVETAPIPVPLASPPAIITRKALLKQLFMGTAKPTYFFPLIARTIRAIEASNQTALADLMQLIVPPAECDCDVDQNPTLAIHSDIEPTFAIACSDAEELVWDPAAYAEYFAGLANTSELMAPLWGHLRLGCMNWRLRPRMRYTGPLEAPHTAHPILVLSSRLDPVSPNADARAVAGRFGGAGLLVQDSVGHATLAAPSVCTAQHVRAYFRDGVLPDEGTVCPPDELPFGVEAKNGVRALSVEDEELMAALRGLSEAMPVRIGW